VSLAGWCPDGLPARAPLTTSVSGESQTERIAIRLSPSSSPQHEDDKNDDEDEYDHSAADVHRWDPFPDFGASFRWSALADQGAGWVASRANKSSLSIRLDTSVVVPSTSNGVAHGSEDPNHQSNHEQNHSDCPHN